MLSSIRPYFLLGLFSLLLFLPGIGSIPVIDRDEAHFVQASKQMVQTEHYFQIRFQDTTRFQKPPGINWLQALSLHLLSHHAYSDIWLYRLPSFLAALLSVLFTYFFAMRFIGKEAAFWGAAFLASSLLLVVEAHMAVIDASLLFSVVLMQGALWIIYYHGLKQARVHGGWACLFWLAMAFGFLLKGVTPLVAILSIFMLCVIERQVAWLRGLYFTRGVLLFIVCTLAWVLPVNQAEHSNYLLQMLHKDLLPKLQGGHESHGQPPLFHLVTLPLMFWPASLFLWQGGLYTYKKWQNPHVRFLFSWIGPAWIFFEVMPTKLPQYVLPLFPAIALLCALGCYSEQEKSKGLARWSQIAWMGLSCGFSIALSALYFVLIHPVSAWWFGFFLLFCTLCYRCMYVAIQGKYRKAMHGILLTALFLFPMLFMELLPSLSPLWISKNLYSLLDKKDITESQPLVAMGYAEPSLVFYFGTKHVLFTDNSTIKEQVKKYPKSFFVVTKEEVNFLNKGEARWRTVAHLEGYNYNKGRSVKLVVLKQVNGSN